MTVFLAIIALFLLWGMVGDRDRENRRNYTLAFIACVAAIVAITNI